MFQSRITPSQQSWLEPKIRVMQIIVLALCLGVISFAAIVVFIVNFKFHFAVDYLTVFGALFTVPCVLVSLLLRFIIFPKRARQIVSEFASEQSAGDRFARESKSESVDESLLEKLVDTYQTQIIIGCALLEGPAFFWLLTAFVGNGNAVGLAAAAALVAFMAGLFVPTPSRVIDWMERQMNQASTHPQKTIHGR